MDRNTLIDFMLCRTTPEQEREVLDWLDESPENQKEMDALDETFNAMALHAPLEASKPKSRRGFVRIFRYAAAVAACIALVIGGGYLFSSWRINRFAGQTVAFSSPAGETVNITLQDGTQVWLTGGSTLEYPVAFTGRSRNVSVDGEAVFDVKHWDGNCPFVVNTFAGKVEVLGTKFDVRADKETGEFSTALLRGRVRMSSKTESVVLEPGQVAGIQDGRLKVQEMESADDYLWVEGVLVLNTPSLEKLSERIERIYDVSVRIDSKSVPAVMNRGKIHTSDGLEHALRIILAGTGLSYEIDYETRQVHIR